VHPPNPRYPRSIKNIKMKSPLVSVIIPAYNAEKYIERTLSSVLSQDYENLEIVVIDDGSNDNTADVVKKLADKDKRLQYVHQQNGGVSSARNHGYKLSKGEYLAFLDADDIWLPDNLSKKLAHLQDNPDIGLVHSDAVLIDENDKPLDEIKKGKSGWILDDLLSWNGTCIPAPSSILVKREVVDTAGGFDTNLSTAADQEFFFRVAAKYKIGRVEEVTWQYRMHSQNMHSNIALMEHDCLLSYKRATENNLFKSASFRRKCYSNMYIILSGSWYHDGKNKGKAVKYGFKAIWVYPPAILRLISKFILS